jgi:hypothetical protein
MPRTDIGAQIPWGWDSRCLLDIVSCYSLWQERGWEDNSYMMTWPSWAVHSKAALRAGSWWPWPAPSSTALANSEREAKGGNRRL